MCVCDVCVVLYHVLDKQMSMCVNCANPRCTGLPSLQTQTELTHCPWSRPLHAGWPGHASEMSRLMRRTMRGENTLLVSADASNDRTASATVCVSVCAMLNRHSSTKFRRTPLATESFASVSCTYIMPHVISTTIAITVVNVARKRRSLQGPRSAVQCNKEFNQSPSSASRRQPAKQVCLKKQTLNRRKYIYSLTAFVV